MNTSDSAETTQKCGLFKFVSRNKGNKRIFSRFLVTSKSVRKFPRPEERCSSNCGMLREFSESFSESMGTLMKRGTIFSSFGFGNV